MVNQEKTPISSIVASQDETSVNLISFSQETPINLISLSQEEAPVDLISVSLKDTSVDLISASQEVIVSASQKETSVNITSDSQIEAPASICSLLSQADTDASVIVQTDRDNNDDLRPKRKLCRSKVRVKLLLNRLKLKTVSIGKFSKALFKGLKNAFKPASPVIP